MFIRKFFVLVWLYSLVPGQTSYRYPADSLFHDPATSLAARVGLVPIALWERLSYRTHFLDCQHAPSCSRYGAEAIARYGLVRGSVVTADRIVRCNPAARYYQLREGRPFRAADGRLVDPVQPPGAPDPPEHHPLVAAGLSVLLPGAGRWYAGHPLDGVYGFTTVFLLGSLAREAEARGHPLRRDLLASATVVFYLGEIYGAWRTARYYHKTQSP